MTEEKVVTIKRKKKPKKPPREWDFYATEEIYEVGELDSLGDKVTYTAIPMHDLWVDAKKFRPEKYDLVALDYGHKIKNGWWNGNHWDGMKVNPKEQPIYWSKRDCER